MYATEEVIEGLREMSREIGRPVLRLVVQSRMDATVPHQGAYSSSIRGKTTRVDHRVLVDELDNCIREDRQLHNFLSHSETCYRALACLDSLLWCASVPHQMRDLSPSDVDAWLAKRGTDSMVEAIAGEPEVDALVATGALAKDCPPAEVVQLLKQCTPHLFLRRNAKPNPKCKATRIGTDVWNLMSQALLLYVDGGCGVGKTRWVPTGLLMKALEVKPQAQIGIVVQIPSKLAADGLYRKVALGQCHCLGP